MIPPRATYRLQLSRDFGFAAAARVAPYLAALGVSHVYASPYLKARPGSTHGYDIVDHRALNPELGAAADFDAMNRAFAAAGLKQILDFVPNHMGVGGADNPLWLEVLEWGPESAYAGWFDIDWEPASRYLAEKLLVPILGDQYGAALEDGKLALKFDAAAGEFAVWAYDSHKLPICPLHYARILGDEYGPLERLGDEFSSLMEWRPQVMRRAAELKRELALLVATSDSAHAVLERALGRLNGQHDPARRELDALIGLQYWRASHFRVAGDDINYRRFFNINDLAGIRIELPDVFEHAHALVFRLLREGVLDGLRIDHIDGLLDPKAYLERLRAVALQRDGAQRPFYLIVEKIFARDEPMRPDWPVEGATGYEFTNLLSHLLLDPRAEEGMTCAYREFTGERRSFAAIVRDCKIRIMKNEMASELHVLARDAARVARQNPRTADFTRNILQRAIRELVASFPVYRTYLDASGVLSDVDRKYLDTALATARAHERDLDPSVFDFLESLLTGELVAAPKSGFSRHAALRCAMKLQQYSGPVMAKGLEDTAFYRYHRLIALNEVGGHPDHFGVTPAQFHAANQERARALPHSLLSTSTHDTKRGEDARARLLVLSEMPERWLAQVRQWSAQLGGPREKLADANIEYFFYQLLVGSWPAELCGSSLETPAARAALESFAARVRDAMQKSVREAKEHTTWAVPNESYESALGAFIDAAFAAPEFLASFGEFATEVARRGVRNSLVQTVLKLTVPGVPDTYQGAELWDLNLVDPDNRRPVDFDARRVRLELLGGQWRADPQAALAATLASWQDGGIKLWVTHLLLAFRREHEALFASGAYQPCAVHGDTGARICAFERHLDGQRLLVVVARHSQGDLDDALPGITLRLSGNTADTWRNLLNNKQFTATEVLDCAALLETLPVAVLYAGLSPAPRPLRAG